MANKTKTFRLNEEAVDRYNDIFNAENLITKKLHKEVFIILLNNYSIDYKKTENIISPPLQNGNALMPIKPINDNPITFTTSTELEQNIEVDISIALKNQIRKLLKSNKKHFKSEKGVCRHLAGKILQLPPDSAEVQKLGENIYRASLNNNKISVSNLIELEMKTEINLSDELNLSPTASLKSLQRLFDMLKDKDIPTNQLSRHLKVLVDILIDHLENKGDFIEFLSGLTKKLTS